MCHIFPYVSIGTHIVTTDLLGDVMDSVETPQCLKQGLIGTRHFYGDNTG
jgi:hypothetical protein